MAQVTDSSKWRFKLARERAGLSIGQAVKLLAISAVELVHIESGVNSPENFGLATAHVANVYGVNEEWLLGAIDRYDYKTVDKMRGADTLTGHDRDTVAEFAASMPTAPALTLADIKARAEAKRHRDGGEDGS